MFKNMKLSAKMFFMGAGIVLALGVLGFIVYYANTSISSALTVSDERYNQLELVQEMREHQLTLMLAAMDAIVDKESGEIDKELTDAFADVSAFFDENLPLLHEYADTAEEKDLANNIGEYYEHLIQGITVDLVDLVDKYNDLDMDIMVLEEGFAGIDDSLDGYGTAIGEALGSIETSIKAEQVEASEELNSVLASTSMMAIVTFVIAVIGIVAVFTLFARSIVKALTSIIESLTSGSEQVAAASGQVSSSSQQMAEGSSEQASSLEEVSSSLEEMTSMT
ncbi:hypothetical protein ACFL6P_09485, partial [Candidatus Latescibacterota bacterium]